MPVYSYYFLQMSHVFLKITGSSLAHLRIPFSFLLLPCYLMALVMTTDIDAVKAMVIFISLHLFLYPGASGFNAYYDRDTASIGMLKNPPAVTPDLLWLSIGLKIVAVLMALLAGPVMAAGSLLYAVASILYSWDRVRLKKYPFGGWLLTGIGQGFVMFTAITLSLPQDGPAVPSHTLLAEAVCMALMMLAASPLLEIFQHEEDARRGDFTISMLLGVRGTLLLSGMLFAVAVTGLSLLMGRATGVFPPLFFLLSLVPAMLLFIRLYVRVSGGDCIPDYNSMTVISFAASSGLNGFCLMMLLWRYFIHDYFL